jgi:SOS-response transcriptional repressor LexA
MDTTKAPKPPGRPEKVNRSLNRPLTPKQLKCLKALHWYITRHGIAPTQEELSKMLGLKAKQGCKGYLDALVKKKYIKRDKDAWRGLTVLIHPLEAERQSHLMLRRDAQTKRELGK